MLRGKYLAKMKDKDIVKPDLKFDDAFSMKEVWNQIAQMFKNVLGFLGFFRIPVKATMAQSDYRKETTILSPHQRKARRKAKMSRITRHSQQLQGVYRKR